MDRRRDHPHAVPVFERDTKQNMVRFIVFFDRGGQKEHEFSENDFEQTEVEYIWRVDLRRRSRVRGGSLYTHLLPGRT